METFAEIGNKIEIKSRWVSFIYLQELIYLRESQLLAGDGLYGHHDESDVAVGRLLLSPHSCSQFII